MSSIIRMTHCGQILAVMGPVTRGQGCHPQAPLISLTTRVAVMGLFVNIDLFEFE